jgi:glucose-6-phosphate dehydrogenase assembly protein OpcA
MPEILPADPVARHWEARATSVAEIESQLSRIWSAAADDATEGGMSADAAADALGDPRVAGHLLASGHVRVRARTRVLTLVVVASRPETAERAVTVVETLAGRHPSRAILLAPGDPDGPSTLDARLSMTCTLRRDSLTETCAERIVLRAGGELSRHLAGVVTPLLIHDLPVVLWWPDDPPIGSRQFRELVETCDELLVDSASFRDDGVARLTAMAAAVAAGAPSVRDVGWMRLEMWREQLAGLFDHPLLTAELPTIRSVRIDVLRPGQTLRISKALGFAGWLASSLDWEVAQPVAQKTGSDSLAGVWTNGRHEVRLEIRSVNPQGAAPMRAAGSLQRVELELGRGRHAVRARVSRQPDHLLATAEWDGAEIARRVGRRDRFEEAPYVTEALDRLGHDRVFEEAVRHAARLVPR